MSRTWPFFLTRPQPQDGVLAYPAPSALRMSKAGLPLSMSKEIFGFPIFPVDKDNFTARDPCTWRYREETRVMPMRRNLILRLCPRLPARRPCQKIWFHEGITLCLSFRASTYSMQWNYPCPREKNRKSKNSLGHGQRKVSLGHSQCAGCAQEDGFYCWELICGPIFLDTTISHFLRNGRFALRSQGGSVDKKMQTRLVQK